MVNHSNREVHMERGPGFQGRTTIRDAFQEERHRRFGPRTVWQVEDAGLRAIKRKLVLAMPTAAAKA
jgi:hypothetical protein